MRIPARATGQAAPLLVLALVVLWSTNRVQAQLLDASGQAFATVRQRSAGTEVQTDRQSAEYPSPGAGAQAVAQAGQRRHDPFGNIVSEASCTVTVDRPTPLPLGTPLDFVINANALTTNRVTDYTVTGRGVQTRTFNLAPSDALGDTGGSGGVQVSRVELRSFLELNGLVGLITDASGVAPEGLEARLEIEVVAAGNSVLSGQIRLFGDGTETVATQVTGDIPPEALRTLTRDLGDGRRMVLGIVPELRLPFAYSVVPETPFDISGTLTATISTTGGTTGGTVIAGAPPEVLFQMIRAIVAQGAPTDQLDEAEQAVDAALGIAVAPPTAPQPGLPCALPLVAAGLAGLVAWGNRRSNRRAA